MKYMVVFFVNAKSALPKTTSGQEADAAFLVFPKLHAKRRLVECLIEPLPFFSFISNDAFDPFVV